MCLRVELKMILGNNSRDNWQTLLKKASKVFKCKRSSSTEERCDQQKERSSAIFQYSCNSNLFKMSENLCITGFISHS